MEFFLPSFFLLLLALLVIFLVLPKFAPFALAIFAAVALVFAAINHATLFSGDYRMMIATSNLVKYAPIIMIGAVIVFSIGYVFLFLRRGIRISLPDISMKIPPPNTSTNIITRAVGNGLQAAGIAQVAASPAATPAGISANTPSRSLVSMSPSLQGQLSTAQEQSILASRLARAI